MDLKVKSLLLLVLFAYGINAQGIWDDPDGDKDDAAQLEDCVTNSMAGKCVTSRLLCRTRHDGGDFVTWRSTDTPCKTGVCCKLADVIDPNTPSGPATPPSSGGGTTPPSSGGGTTRTVAPPPVMTTVGPTLPEASAGCGIPKRQTLASFVKSKTNEADLGEYPWAVLILRLLAPDGKRKRFEYVATGSIIHDRVVLSAAHLLQNGKTNNLRVSVGQHDRTGRVMENRFVEVIEVVRHENFNTNGDYNVALLFLKASALGLPHVGTVCLPPASYVAPAGTNCAFAGWGADSQMKFQNQLTKTQVPIVDHSACQSRFRLNPKLGPGFYLLDSLMCAGGEVGKDLCGGAGGSPLVCPIDGEQARFVQTGIVSWVTDACGVDGEPAVFANVALARPWIDQQMASHQYTTESYTY